MVCIHCLKQYIFSESNQSNRGITANVGLLHIELKRLFCTTTIDHQCFISSTSFLNKIKNKKISKNKVSSRG